MAIVHCYEVWDMPRVATESKQINSDGPPVVSSVVSRYFHVETSTQTDSEVVVRNAVDPITAVAIPVSGAPHPENAFLFALNYNIRHLGGGIYWLIQVDYLSVGSAQNPLLEPPVNEWSTQKWSAAIDVDRFNNPIANAAGESYDVPIVREFSDLVLKFSCNIAVYDTSKWAPFLNTVNSDVFRGFDISTAKVSDITAVEQFRGSSSYFRLAVTILFRHYVRKGQGGVTQEWGWIKIVANKGFNKRVTNTSGAISPTQPILDANGLPVHKSVWLVSDGSGAADLIAQPSAANWRNHEIYDQSKFSDMNLLAPGITG